MRLSLSISQNIGQQQRQVQKMSVAQRQEIRAEMSQQMSAEIFEVMGKIDMDPDSIYDLVVEQVVTEMPEELQLPISQILRQTAIKAQILVHPVQYALPRTTMATDLQKDTVSALHNETAGSFDTSTHGNTSAQNFHTVPMGKLQDAFTDPEKILKKINEDEALMSGPRTAAGGIGEGMHQELRELRSALAVHEFTKEKVKSIVQAFQFAFLQKGADGTSILHNFLRDVTILKQFSHIVSDRMQTRFAKRFLGGVSKGDSSKKHEVAFINTIGEFTLTAMGVVAPELFVLQKGEVSESAYENAKELLAKEGVDLDALMQKYQLQTAGTFMWNRWAVKGHKPTKVTDELVRDFMVQTVREHSAEILEAANFNKVFNQVLEIHQEHTSSVEDRKNAHDALRQLLVDTFSKESLINLLVQKIRTEWFAKLEIFFKKDI